MTVNRRGGAFRILLLVLASAALLPPGCDSAGGHQDGISGQVAVPLDAETQGMVRRLETLARETEELSPFDFTARIRVAERMLGDPRSVADHLQVLGDIAYMKNISGDPRGAVEALRTLRRLCEEKGVTLPAEMENVLRRIELISHLRIGEVDNCLERNNRDCCLFPIQGGGLHREPQGFQAAERILREELGKAPRSLSLRWLLTVVTMALGKPLQGDDARLLLDPPGLHSERPFPRFPECAAELGIAVNDLAGGSILDDFDGDGRLDVVLSSWSKGGQLRFFRNAGGRFVERTREAGLEGITGGLNIAQTDYDDDGRLDIYIARGAWLDDVGLDPDSLLRNNGDGTFSDRTESSGLLSHRPNLAFVWADFDNDGWLDLYVGCESMGRANYPAELYLNQRDGRFVECAAASGAAVIGLIRGIAAGDYDNDGWMDIYISRLGQPNILLRNRGASAEPGGRRFEDVTARAGVAEPLLGFPCWFWDHDNDGWLDIFVAGYSSQFDVRTLEELVKDMMGLPCALEKPRLYRNAGNGTFVDVTALAGLDRVIYAMGANFGDLDNDGFLDFYAGTGNPDLTTLIPNRMFWNDGGKRFLDVTTNGGFGHLQKGHGVAFGDLDDDGDQDVVINLGGAAKGDNFLDAVFRNPGFGNGWVSFNLRGTKANRAAIGARVKVTVEGKDGARAIHRMVGSGGSFGASTLRLEVGLGDATRIREVEVRWPGSGRIDRFTRASAAGIEPRARYLLVEGEASARRLSP